jgi:hypothetical protein
MWRPRSILVAPAVTGVRAVTTHREGMRLIVSATAIALLALAPAGVHAERWTADVELDPTAFVLDGYSIHAGLSRGHLRVDLGAYAMALPGFVHGNDGFDASFDGYGVKLQYFRRVDRRGLFAGIDAGVSRLLVEKHGTDLAVRQHQVGGGVHGGWRFALPAAFYATAWLGVGYNVGAADVMLEGARFEMTRLVVFPAIHVGRRFE